MRLFKRSKPSQAEQTSQENSVALAEDQSTANAGSSWLNRLKTGLQRTRQQFTQSLANIVLGKKTIDAELLEEIETHLLLADVGVIATQSLLKDLTEKIARKELDNPERLLQKLKEDLEHILTPCAQPLIIDATKKPFVILMVGINGAGKTTTIGKLAKHLQQQGKKVMLAAGDTFRAAAVEQLQVWGERNSIPVIAQQSGADSASVIYDALAAAKARGMDVLLADTAGRLHTQSHLMAELQKVKRVMAKLDAQAPHEICLVLDAGIGQNTLQQAQQFHAALGLTGLVLTKLDGTAKGGVIFALAKQMQLPIRFIGVGEGIDDLRPFVPSEFIDALF
jgi:fused signal recognition particle receptor